MFAFLTNLVLLFAESGGEAATGSWSEKLAHFWSEYMNIPGFEGWRFLNLLVFILIAMYLLKKPLSEKFKQKREEIRAELIRAEEERQAAITELTEAEALLARLDTEIAIEMKDAESEAAGERKRIGVEADHDISRIKNQALNDIRRRTQQANLTLRRLSADESIRLAEEKIKNAMNLQKDAELVKANIHAIGGLK